jgi:hypothetical protein
MKYLKSINEIRKYKLSQPTEDFSKYITTGCNSFFCAIADIDSAIGDGFNQFPNERTSTQGVLNAMIGELIVDVKITRDKGEMLFVVESSGCYELYVFYHEQDCCESVYVEDISGSLDDLIDNVIIKASEETNNNNPGNKYESVTWTFYKLATKDGYITIRWCGNSNGYYSESVKAVKYNHEYTRDELELLYISMKENINY